MNVTEHRLTLTVQADDHECELSLIYRGNENVLIKFESEQQLGVEIRVPRNVLEKFLEMIK